MNQKTYKMIAMDLDDTLLNDQVQISEATKKAIARATELGVIVTIATGRMFASARKIAKQLELNVPIITYQGSLVRNIFDEKVFYERFVPLDVAQYIYAYAEENGLHLQIYYEDTLYVQTDNQKIKDYSTTSNISYNVAEDFKALISKPLIKMLFIDEPEILDEIAIELKAALGSSVHITKSKPHYLEFLHPEGTKGHALSNLAAYYGCELSQVIAIGDSWNDREMLEIAGLGVAVSNAVDALKEIADFITLSNNEDGVKFVIDKFVFHEIE